jgi:hypothetical protein
MTTRTTRKIPRASGATMRTVAIACALCSANALAQTTAPARPWYLGLDQDFTHMSNVLGSQRGNEVSDTISTTTLLGGINTRLGRQTLYADAQLNTTKHRRVDDRDTDGYSLGVGLDWSTVERLSGTFKLGATQRQTQFGGSGITQVSLSNVEKTQEFDATVRLGAVALMTIEAGAGWRKVDFSAQEFSNAEYDQTRGTLGLIYRPSGLLTLRGGVYGTRTEYDVSNARANDSGVYLGGTWVPSGISTVTADLSYGRERATAVSEGFRGATGTLAWAWRPTGRLSTNVTLSRLKGRDAGFSGTSSSPTSLPLVALTTPTRTADNFSQVTNRFAVSGNYELTGKITMSASLGVSERTYGSTTTSGGKDRESSITIGARWAALRTVSVGCDIGYSDRDNTSALNSDARNEQFGCSVGVRLD